MRGHDDHVPFGDLRASLITALDDLSAAEEAHAIAAQDLNGAQLEEKSAAADVQRKRGIAKKALIDYGVESAL